MTEAAVVTSNPTPAPAPAPAEPAGVAKFAELSGDAYSTAKQEFIAANGEHAWRSMMSQGLAPPPSEPAPAKNGEAKPNGANGHDKAEDGEAGEDEGGITINAEGKAINKATGRYIPQSAYLRVKGEAKEAKSQNDVLVKSVVQLQEKLATILERGASPQTTQANEPEKEIDPSEDIFGAFNQLSKKLKALETKGTEAHKETSAQIEAREMRDRFVSDAQRFTSREASFPQAYQYLMESLHTELAAEGVSDEKERASQIAENIRDRATRLLKQGKSPAETIFAIAKARGFAAKPANDPNAEKEAKAKAELERINATKSATHTLNGAGGTGGMEGLTLQKLASLTGEDYSSARRAFISKHGEAAWRQMIGG
jgi:hypothetical protein